MIPRLMETNVYTPKGRVLLVGSCLPEVWPEAYEALAREAEPEASLTELAAMMDPPITKPAMNSRMKKLVQLSKEAAK